MNLGVGHKYSNLSRRKTTMADKRWRMGRGGRQELLAFIRADVGVVGKGSPVVSRSDLQ